MARAKDSTLVKFDEDQIHEFLNRTIREAVKEVFEALLEAEAAELAQAPPMNGHTCARTTATVPASASWPPGSARRS